MNKLLAVAALLAAAPVAHAVGPAAAGGTLSPSAVGAADSGIVLVGGMGGGGAGGMSGGAGGGGMGGGGAGGMSGGGGMGGGSAGGMFHDQTTDFDRPGQEPWDSASRSDNYTYRCITPAGRCAFVAPASLRANSLHSGADCACGGHTAGRVE
jgi:hypothetical protein